PFPLYPTPARRRHQIQSTPLPFLLPVPVPVRPPSASHPRIISLPSRMDWQGQKRAEMLMQVLLVAAAVAAFLVGYVRGDFQLMLLVYAGGVVLTALVTVPNWPFFNRNPLKWLDAAEAERHPRPQVSTSSAAAGGKKKSRKNK
ncbi:unnamed protein product, partial [Urochloa humidicola]